MRSSSKREDNNMMKSLLIFLYISTLCGETLAFLLSPARPREFSVKRHRSHVLYYALPTPEESAQALTEYMSRAHEEKLRAIAEAEARSKGKVEELRAEITHLRALLDEAEAAAPATPQDEPGRCELSLTNKAASEMIDSYKKFISEYIVKANEHRLEAVKNAEAAVKATYEEKIAQLKAEQVSSLSA